MSTTVNRPPSATPSQAGARPNVFRRILNFYIEGFREMRTGKILWTVILIKLFIIFFVLKLFFFPDVVKQKAKDGDRAGVVAKELVGRQQP